MKNKLLFMVMLICMLGLVAQAEVIRDTSYGNGADTYLSNDGQSGNYGPDSLHGSDTDLQAFRAFVGTRMKIGYIRFDISEVSGDMSGSYLVLNLPSTKGVRTVTVYGLVDTSEDNWDEATTSYNTAPGFVPNPPTALAYYEFEAGEVTASLGTLQIQDTAPEVVTTDPQVLDLTSFLEADTNGLVTFIFIGDNNEATLASKENTSYPAPTLVMPNASLGGAIDPVPGDETTVNKNTLTQLSWTLIPGVATCEVYFGTEPNVLTVDSIYFDPAVESVDIDDFASFSAPLDPDIYHWRVDAWDSDPVDPNYFEGMWWSFTATALPVFVDISPAYQAKIVGESADAITASFSSSTAMSYAWYRSDDDATDTPPDDPVGTDSDTLSLGTLALGDAGYYYCVADNGGATPSDTARVSIKRQIIHYAFDGNVEDSSGNDLDGIHIGEPNFVNDAIFGQALWFDGIGDYVQCPNDLDLTVPAFDDFTPGMTVTVWAKPDAVANWGRFTDFGSGPGVDNILFTRMGTTTTLRLDTSNGTVNAGNAIDLDEWQMFAVTMDHDGNVVLYKNGRPLETDTDTVDLPALAPRTLNYIGESNWSGDSFYSGLMDDLQVWNYPLTEDEIADMYAASVGNFCRFPISENYDYDDNCIVNLADFADFASMWLECGFYPECTF